MTPIFTVTLNPSLDVSTSVDQVIPTEKLRCADPVYDPGGGGINVARVVTRLGGHAHAIFPLGGPTGRALGELLEREAIDCRPVVVSGMTREALSIFERSGGRQFRFVMPGPMLTETEWRACLDLLASSAPSPSYIVASGSLPPGAPDDFYARIARMAKEKGARFVLDTSGPALSAAVREGVWLMKPNREEFISLLGGGQWSDEELAIRAENLVRQGGAEIVMLSLGADGAYLVTPRGSRHFRPPEVEVVSAVGAGDSLVGAMVLALSRQYPIERAACFGIAAGTAALATPGTELCNRDDTERLFHRMCSDVS